MGQPEAGKTSSVLLTGGRDEGWALSSASMRASSRSISSVVMNMPCSLRRRMGGLSRAARVSALSVCEYPVFDARKGVRMDGLTLGGRRTEDGSASLMHYGWL